MSRATEARAPRPFAGPADALEGAVRLAVAALHEAPSTAWERKAGSLEWDCWETVEHLSGALFTYAVQLGPSKPPLERNVPFVRESRRAGGPTGAVHADRAAGPAGLLEVLEASGALLVAMVRTASPQVRAHHVFGVSDPEGFAAMGTIETLVHTYDLAQGLGLAWNPPADLCLWVLARLFPDVPEEGHDPWATLLWATGRGALPGHSRRTGWRWDASVRARG
ncbi:maleylpyruvate isomerase N-terminal domain-containing protein [Streptomyces sioyaensis]|uniref:maleylpyruvate isomerase N-terminal domain-containing protein n=1 Tax=Streptomyces sioyaensis TaxID=67364 RepID=UPI00369A11AF